MGFRVGEAFLTKGAPKATAQSAAGSSSVIDLTGDDDSPAPKTTAPKRPASHPPGTFAPGTELVLHGLERRPDLNGAKVRVQSFDEQSKRYVVEVLQLSSGAKPSEADATKAIKSANLRPARQGTSAPVVIDLDDGDSAPPAKRQRGAEKEVAPGKARQNKPATSATPPASSPAPVPTAAAVPPPSFAMGADVTVRGLESRPDLNGATARVQRWDAQSGRYVVEILRLASGATPAASDTSKALKPKNLERRPPPRPPPQQPQQPPQQQAEKEKENETGKRETVRKPAQQQQAAARAEQERLQRERQQAAAAERKQRLQREKAERDEARARERDRAREREAAAELQRRREQQEATS